MHLNSDDDNINIVLLTDDVENKTRAAEEGLFVVSSKIYLILSY